MTPVLTCPFARRNLAIALIDHLPAIQWTCATGKELPIVETGLELTQSQQSEAPSSRTTSVVTPTPA